MKDFNGLESQLFEWNGWDSISEVDFYFYHPILKVKIGNHDIGTKFRSVAFMMSCSTLEFYDEDGNVISTHKLKITAE